LEKIGIKLDAHKLKKSTDFTFVFVEKIVLKFKKLLPPYLDFYNEMVKNEIALAEISRKDKILHVGCGPIPVTAILVSEKTSAKVTGIDRNRFSVKQAQRLLLELKLSDKVRVEYAEALQYPLGSFDLVIVSQGIKPYNETLEYISQYMRNDARVIFRTSSSARGELVDKDLFLKNIFTVRKIVPQKRNGLLISILLSKK